MEETVHALKNGLRRGLVFAVAFTGIFAALKYASLHSDGYMITVSYTAIMGGGVLVFLATFLVRAGYNLYYRPPPRHRFPPDE